MPELTVIGAGLPRTGTLSQKLAFEKLGFGPCYHWVDVIADLEGRVPQWDRALDGEEHWDEIFDGFQSTVDWPGGFFYAELASAYPNAKVVLSVRDAERWEQSFRETIWNMCFGETLVRYASAARAQIDPRWERYLHLVDRMFWIERGTFASGYAEPAQLIAAMKRHEQAVKQAIPSDRLLVWDVTEGWGLSATSSKLLSRRSRSRMPMTGIPSRIAWSPRRSASSAAGTRREPIQPAADPPGATRTR